MRILVIRFTSLGDVILTTPVVAALRERYPQARIDYLVMQSCSEAIEGNPHIDTLIRFDKERYGGLIGLTAFARRLDRYDLIIDLHAKLRSRILSVLVPGSVLRYRKRSWWKALLVHLRLVRYRADATIVSSYFKALASLEIPPGEENLSFRFSRADQERVAAHAGAVVLAIGAANPTKRWPVEHFARLGEMLSDPIVIIGGNAEKRDGERIRRRIGSRCTNLAGALSLKESGALLATARYVVCNDSVSFHMARAVGSQAFVIFGPTDPGMFTYDDRAVLIRADTACAPCSLHGDRQCPQGHFDCMRKLTPDVVRAVIDQQVVR
ncbi:MAG: glycosyltransferase family 9 protein [Desulfosarcinaceae bacterium]|nr:glycosyltransferase family 9 protein [Desulfosarcinaceae bacterium]